MAQLIHQPAPSDVGSDITTGPLARRLAATGLGVEMSRHRAPVSSPSWAWQLGSRSWHCKATAKPAGTTNPPPDPARQRPRPRHPYHPPGRRYPLRSRLFCSICHRRMAGQGRTTTKGRLTYYRRPHDPAIPRHVAAYPDHRNVWVREEPLMAAIAGFFTERVFGPDRAAMLDATLPRTAAAQAARDAARAGMLCKKLTKIDTAETALISELEQTPEGMPEAAVAAYRQRLRTRFTELYTQRSTLQDQLDTLTAPSDEPVNDPALLDELPLLGDIITNAPGTLIERLLAIFDVNAVYNRDKHQLTITPPSPARRLRPSATCSSTHAPTTTSRR